MGKDKGSLGRAVIVYDSVRVCVCPYTFSNPTDGMTARINTKVQPVGDKYVLGLAHQL